MSPRSPLRSPLFARTERKNSGLLSPTPMGRSSSGVMPLALGASAVDVNLVQDNLRTPAPHSRVPVTDETPGQSRPDSTLLSSHLKASAARQHSHAVNSDPLATLGEMIMIQGSVNLSKLPSMDAKNFSELVEKFAQGIVDMRPTPQMTSFSRGDKPVEDLGYTSLEAHLGGKRDRFFHFATVLTSDEKIRSMLTSQTNLRLRLLFEYVQVAVGLHRFVKVASGMTTCRETALMRLFARDIDAEKLLNEGLTRYDLLYGTLTRNLEGFVCKLAEVCSELTRGEAKNVNAVACVEEVNSVLVEIIITTAKARENQQIYPADNDAGKVGSLCGFALKRVWLSLDFQDPEPLWTCSLQFRNALK